jgi:RNA polymerase sigma-70 factor, ECF subfamily
LDLPPLADVPTAAEQSTAAEYFASLAVTCRRPVFLYAMSLLHNVADAEEVLQETEVVLWRKFDQYQPGTDFVRWACGIAHFEAMKIRTSRARDARLFSDGFVEMLAAESLKSPDLLETRRQALAQCLAKLSESDRQLVLGRYEPGATTRTVAKTLGRSVQGTRKTLHRIRKALLACVRRTLAREGDA